MRNEELGEHADGVLGVGEELRAVDEGDGEEGRVDDLFHCDGDGHEDGDEGDGVAVEDEAQVAVAAEPEKVSLGVGAEGFFEMDPLNLFAAEGADR